METPNKQNGVPETPSSPPVEAVVQKKGKSFLPRWIFIAAIIALGVAAYLTLNYYKGLADQQENYAEAMGMGADQEERKTKRMHEQADAARNLAIEIAAVHKHDETPAQISDDAEAKKAQDQALVKIEAEYPDLERDWTFKTGARRKGKFVRLDGNAIVVDFSEGQSGVFTVPLENLSLFDQAVARTMAAAGKRP